MLKQAGISFISASLLVAGCGGGSSSSDDGGTTTTTVSGVAITTSKTSQVIDQSISLSSTLSGSRDTASAYKLTTSTTPESQLYAPLASAMALRPSRAESSSVSSKVTDISSMCSVGGSALVDTPDFLDANPYEVTMTFTDCNDGTFTTNGVISLSETTKVDGYDFTISMGSVGNPYTMTDGSITMTTAVTMNGSDNLDGSVGSASMNGTMGMTFGGDSLSVEFTTLITSWNETGTTSTSSMNGGMSMSATSSGVTEGFSVTFTTFTFAEDYMASSTTVNGTVAFSSTPASCGDGSYTFTTLEPIVDYGAGPVSGIVKINTATVSYNSDGSVLITLNDGTSRTYTPAQLEAAVCTA